MSIQEVPMFRVLCDRCGASAQDGDFYAWKEADHAEAEAEASEWLVADGRHHCPDCTVWDDEKDERVPKPADSAAAEAAV